MILWNSLKLWTLAFVHLISVISINYLLTIPQQLIPLPRYSKFCPIDENRSFDLNSNHSSLFSYFCETVAAEESKAEDGQFRGPETGVGHWLPQNYTRGTVSKVSDAPRKRKLFSIVLKPGWRGGGIGFASLSKIQQQR